MGVFILGYHLPQNIAMAPCLKIEYFGSRQEKFISTQIQRHGVVFECGTMIELKL